MTLSLMRCLSRCKKAAEPEVFSCSDESQPRAPHKKQCTDSAEAEEEEQIEQNSLQCPALPCTLTTSVLSFRYSFWVPVSFPCRVGPLALKHTHPVGPPAQQHLPSFSSRLERGS